MQTNISRTLRRTTALVGSLTALSFASCDNFIAPDPTDVLAPENFYKSRADAISAVNSVYSQTQWAYFYYWYQSDVASDDILASANFGPTGFSCQPEISTLPGDQPLPAKPRSYPASRSNCVTTGVSRGKSLHRLAREPSSCA